MDVTAPSASRDAAQGTIAFIVNPASGKGEEDPSGQILDLARNLGWEGRSYRTTLDADGTSMAERALSEGATRLVACGGDGTVMEVAQTLVDKKIELAVVPLGTGNLLSRNLDLPLEMEEAVKLALFGTATVMDCGRANDTVFLINSGIGLDAQIMSGTSRDAKEKLGVFAYILSARKYASGRSSKFSISVDGEKARRCRAKTVFIANMGKIQANIALVPGTDPNDGQLNIAVIEASSPRDWLSLAFNLLRHKPHKSSGYRTLTAEKCVVTVEGQALPYQCDGNDFDPVSVLKLEVIPSGITIIR
jgi:diacylglycerol kinase (ATP)